jgi:hypothetical protein
MVNLTILKSLLKFVERFKLETKYCYKCKQTKPTSLFHVCNSRKSGLQDMCKECAKKFRKPNSNPESKRLYDLNYYSKPENKKHQKIRAKQYYIANKQIIISRNIIYKKERRNSDLEYRIRDNLRARFYQAVKYEHKSASVLKLIGCTIKFYRSYLEKLWTEGMSWSNYGFGSGKWNIDHIVALANFNLTDQRQQCKAFHYTNTQPLWQPLNLSKGRRK